LEVILVTSEYLGSSPQVNKTYRLQTSRSDNEIVDTTHLSASLCWRKPQILFSS